MDLANAVRTLWRRKLLVILALVLGAVAGILTAYSPSLSSPHLKSRGISYGVGSASLIVDLDPSPVGSSGPELSPLVQRAKIFAAILSGDAIRKRVADRLRVPVDQVGISAIGPGTAGDVTGVVRGVQLRNQGAKLRAVVQADIDTPLISITTQAPTGRQAVAMADAVTAAGREYVQDAIRRPGSRSRDAVVLRPVGEAQGGDVNPGADRQAAAVAAVVAFGLILVALLFLARIIGDFRASRSSAPAASRKPDPAS